MEIEFETAQGRQCHLVRPGRTRVGRATDNDITVIDDRVSNRHLLLWCDDPASLRVRDLGSKNGTTLNGESLVGEAVLTPGDQLVLGESVQVRLIATDAAFEATLTPALQPIGDADIHALVDDLRLRGEAMTWALARLDNLAAAPTPQARYRYLVAEVRRQLAGTGARLATVWVLCWRLRAESSTPTFSALVHDQDEVEVPSPAQFARSVVGKAVEAGTPIWIDDARSDSRTQDDDSVFALRLRSVGCLPIGTSAVLYVSDPSSRSAFSEPVKRRLESLCALAGPFGAEAEPHEDSTLSRAAPLPGLAGSSVAMQDVASQARAFARFRWNVLVLGEAGTGKSALASAIHTLSGLDGPLVHVNCATLTDTLAASELFGSVKGAYNDARDRPGYVGRAGGGTLFLDEVGELPRELQSALLVLTRERSYHRVGEEEVPRQFTGRIIAATNRGIDALRPDLAERLSECVIEMPPLRDRRTDVPELAELFVDHLCRAETGATGGATLSLSADALDRLAAGDLDGNVARLKSRLQRAFMWAVVEGASEIGLGHLDRERGQGSADPQVPITFDDAVCRFKRQLLLEALARNDGNKTRTAEQLGMSNRQQLLRQIKKVGLSDADTPPSSEP